MQRLTLGSREKPSAGSLELALLHLVRQQPMRPRIASPPLPTSEPRTSCTAPAAKSAMTPVASLGGGVEKERKSRPARQLTAGLFSEKWAGRGETGAAWSKQSASLKGSAAAKAVGGRGGGRRRFRPLWDPHPPLPLSLPASFVARATAVHVWPASRCPLSI